jgi:hypothetical protein
LSGIASVSDNRFEDAVSEQTPARKPGRPKKYDKVKAGKGGDHGAPYLGLRLDPPVYEHIRAQPEGPRAYVTRLVEEDMREEPAFSTSPDDVPGQLLLPTAPKPEKRTTKKEP